MMSRDKWNDLVDEVYGRKIKVTCTDGTIYEDVGEEYTEEENGKGENEYAITTSSMIFKREDVKKIEFLD